MARRSKKKLPAGVRLIRSDPETYKITVATGWNPATERYGRMSRNVQGDADAAIAQWLALKTELKTKRAAGTIPRRVNDVLDDFLEEKRRINLSPGTIYLYEMTLRLRVRPHIGDRMVADIARRDIADLLAKAKDAGAAAGTVANIRTVLSSAFTFALQNEYVTKNPCATITVAAQDPGDEEDDDTLIVPTPAEVSKLIVAAGASTRPEMARCYYLAATTGSRRGEMCGWRLNDLGDTDVLTIRRSVLNVTGHSRSTKSTKNGKRRPLALDPDSLEVLREQLAAMQDRATLAGVELCDNPFVFSDAPDCSVPWRPDLVSHFFSALRATVGLDHLMFKGFRKFMETYGQSAGHSLTVVALRAGHDPAVAAKHYTGRVTDADRELAVSVANMIDRPA